MTSPVPILFTIPNFITAGSGRAMLNIVERLDRKKFAPAVCVSRKGGRLDREVERLGIPFLEADFAIPAKPYATLLGRAARAARAFRPLAPALWHSFHYGDDYTEPLIARLSGARAWIYTKKNMNWHRRSWQVRSLFASRIAAQNTDMMRYFFQKPRLRRKTVLIPRGVDTERFRPDLPASEGFRERAGIPAAAVVAGCVAHLLPVKGHATLLQAAARVPGLHLLLAGEPLEPEYAASLERLSEELGIRARVHFVGGVARVPEFLLELDIYVLATRYVLGTRGRGEGCPVSLLEAMSSGRACVATNVPGSRDVVEEPRSGLLVPPEDPDSLARALRELVASPDLRRALGREARARILARYTIEQEVAAHEALYDEILSVPRARSANP